MQSSLLDAMRDVDALPTYNAHEWALSPGQYRQRAALANALTVLSTTRDA
jgi:hypothetical protein